MTKLLLLTQDGTIKQLSNDEMYDSLKIVKFSRYMTSQHNKLEVIE